MSDRRHVPHVDAAAFLRKCRAHPERMRVMCSQQARREGGDRLRVTVEVAAGGPTVEVMETSMAAGWTGCRFSPAALWLSLTLAERAGAGEQFLCRGGGGGGDDSEVHALRPQCCRGPRPRALELGCGVALAGLSAHGLGFDTTLTDCLPGHLQNLQALLRQREAREGEPELRVRCLDWLEGATVSCAVDRGSPENVGVSEEYERLAAEEEGSFDLVLASDVLYEEHHAALLPHVLARWLRPGGRYALAYAIRDAPMLQRFFRQLRATGVLATAGGGPAGGPGPVDSDECLLVWQTACVPGKCDFCQKTGDGGGNGASGKVSLRRLEQIIEGHEGGAILVEGVRPAGGGPRGE